MCEVFSVYSGKLSNSEGDELPFYNISSMPEGKLKSRALSVDQTKIRHSKIISETGCELSTCKGNTF